MKTIRDITHSYAEALDGERFPVWEKGEFIAKWNFAYSTEENSTKKKEKDIKKKDASTQTFDY